MEAPNQSLVAHPQSEQPTVEIRSAVADTLAGRVQCAQQPRPGFAEIGPDKQVWEYAALVTSLDSEILTLGQLYRDRAVVKTRLMN
jgi:hypothetical protein